MGAAMSGCDSGIATHRSFLLSRQPHLPDHNPMDEIVKEFLVENYENLDRLDSDLVNLEKDPHSKETLGSIFRTIHTLKGTSGFLGFGKLEAVAHVGENLLSKMRDGILTINPEIASALLATVDAVRSMLSQIEATGDPGNQDYSRLIEQLTLLNDGQPVPAAVSAAVPTPVVAVAPAAPVVVAPEPAVPVALAPTIPTAPVVVEVPAAPSPVSLPDAGAAAVAAETASRLCPVVVPPETFTAALLHDIGKLMMGRFLTAEILGYIRRAQEVDHLSQLDAETLLLNVHHGELGGLIAQHWKLPPRVVLGITHHHHPEQGLDVICDLTYLANQVAKHIEAGLDGQPCVLSFDPGVAERLGMTVQTLENFYPIAATRYAQVSRRYDVV